MPFDYHTEKAIHDDIVELYPKIATAKCYFRDPAKFSVQTAHNDLVAVDRDRVICALANKLVTTKYAIAVLCESRLGDDAFALARVALENAVVVEWLLHDRYWPQRVDYFVRYEADAIVRSCEVTQKHFPNTPGTTSQIDQAIAEQIYAGEWRRWAKCPSNPRKNITFKDMVNEVSQDDFVYDWVYFKMGWYVHSSVPSCRSIVKAIDNDDVYDLRVMPNTERAAEALGLSNLTVLSALGALDKRTRLGLADYLDSLLAKYRRPEA